MRRANQPGIEIDPQTKLLVLIDKPVLKIIIISEHFMSFRQRFAATQHTVTKNLANVILRSPSGVQKDRIFVFLTSSILEITTFLSRSVLGKQNYLVPV